MEVSAEEEVSQVEMQRPHLVILGAGASYAAFPNGDRHGRKLPLMNNLVETLGLEHLLAETRVEFSSRNFEDIYAQIHERPDLTDIRERLEREVYRYFEEMELPDHPTIYDHLVLSLREKDVIATFNWDPFLAQAIKRNLDRCKPPMAIFLHGNVQIGACPQGHMMGINGMICRSCGERFVPSRLLYPITEKNYEKDPFISKQWKAMGMVLKDAFMVTIFGYGAPVSDVGAIKLLKDAWGTVDARNMEEIEIIDIRDEGDLRETWSPFIHTHHYEVSKNFYQSWLANHPRRTGEAYINQFLRAKFIESNPLPKDAGFQELWSWFDKFHTAEAEASAKRT